MGAPRRSDGGAPETDVPEGSRPGSGCLTDVILKMSDRKEDMMGCSIGGLDEETRLLTTATLCLVCSGGLDSFEGFG